MYCLAPAAEPKDADMPAVCAACVNDTVSLCKATMRKATKVRGVDCGCCGTYIPRAVWPDNNPPSICYICDCGKKRMEFAAEMARMRDEDMEIAPSIIKALQAVFGKK